MSEGSGGVAPYSPGRKKGDWWVVRPRAETIDFDSAEDFRRGVVTALDLGERLIAVDLSGVRMVDSTGIGAFVAILKRLDRKGHLRLFGAQATVLSVLQTVKLGELLPHFVSEEEALRAPLPKI